ncbi:MAG: hypothetical protein HFI03_02365 [Lachnospiraceae bacterium]|jgi:hypothetical protein|nr:hypothetical protein [Lachnospiraceae bacterium]
MKKAVIAGMTCLTVFTMSLPVYAHHGQYHCGGQNCGGTYCFIDENGDGICDNSLCVDADGNPVCVTGDHCEYFIDDDGNGICDHCVNQEAIRQANAQTYSRGRGHHGGRHGRCH